MTRATTWRTGMIARGSRMTNRRKRNTRTRTKRTKARTRRNAEDDDDGRRRNEEDEGNEGGRRGCAGPRRGAAPRTASLVRLRTRRRPEGLAAPRAPGLLGGRFRRDISFAPISFFGPVPWWCRWLLAAAVVPLAAPVRSGLPVPATSPTSTRARGPPWTGRRRSGGGGEALQRRRRNEGPRPE